MKINILTVFFISAVTLLQAQVINTEKLRINSDQTGWNGSVDFTFDAIQNTNQIITGGARIRTEYLNLPHRLLLIGQGSLSRVNGQQLVNRSYFHSRYNYSFNKRWTGESFFQIQHNKIQKIGLRSLWGVGPRMNIMDRDTIKLYTGVLYMYEYEELTIENIINRSHRLSAYASFAIALKSWLRFSHISYIQPNLEALSDFRISTDNVWTFSFTKKLSWRIQLLLTYDSEPPFDVPSLVYQLKNGLHVDF
ncbi:DUF481 domain-containing protein [Pontibacter sp. G13]|uniref:DUF481 domain-containing protein n=1 Tax=Pontibacter sp. G13 TaxID=3074898 RepID=UPI002889E9C4|nr:DUF481 domain-containing protein [Pontibacter sp. G13]WNJ15927.1 DUF481 domain-containing protein [Pontibacter sp. G13]